MEYQETLHQTIFVNAKENLTKAHKLIVIWDKWLLTYVLHLQITWGTFIDKHIHLFKRFGN
jgi:hypothetical protein